MTQDVGTVESMAAMRRTAKVNAAIPSLTGTLMLEFLVWPVR